MSVNFYSEKDEFGEFSNFYNFEISIGGKIYPTVEHYFQSKKYDYDGCSEDNLKHSEIIRKSSTPYVAKLLASDPNEVLSQPARYEWMEKCHEILKEVQKKDVKIDPDWNITDKNTNLRKKDFIMLKGLYEKFKDPSLNKVLMSTGNKVLVEHTNRDSYWGDGGDGSGKNMLGKLLMSVRQEYL